MKSNKSYMALDNGVGICRSNVSMCRRVGNNRGNDTALGAFCINANNGLANSNGNNWRSRLSKLIKKF